ncbi:hypothetical protein CA13_59100 [Planctomycetes bacterium CA13]|uniref:Transposase n=2 Tax=Novipirellula herctigrandis TaxID=2527986 RepID=A0A5C5YIL6_9BACT|nr:hypothetical protein CA13_74010 [Planctomycetes bacterium CA13]TWT81087.1 hypothetical protein CA13_25340 [Planctomycetes bacterium CA13]TWT84432.1 hypothetical protein CA13_59100 [Planctomycetes bacterium CA13]
MRRKPLFPPPKSTTGVRARNKGRQLRSVLTENGRVQFKRVRWAIEDQGCSVPIDALLDEAEKSFTRGVREMLCRLNQSSSSFAKTAENMFRLASIDISGESVRQIVEYEGRMITNQLTSGRIDPGWSSADCVIDDKPLSDLAVDASERAEQSEAPGKPRKTRVYIGCDGVKVPVVTDAEKRKRRATIKFKRKRSGKKCRPLPKLRNGSDQQYKEARIVVAYDEQQTHRLVISTRGDCEVTGRLLQTLSTTIGLNQATESIANIDGAPWIRNQLEFHHLVDEINLDYYHLKDNAQKARREMYGDDEAGAKWLDSLMDVLMNRGIDSLLSELVAQKGDCRGRKLEALEHLIGYAAERRAIIRYREFRERGIQIGSGPTEAQCKTTTQRIKGRGRRWDFANAEYLMNIAALDASDLWEKYWEIPAKIAA